MTPDIYAEWLHLQGHRVLRTASTYWHSCGARAYQAFPYHWVIQPTDDELADFIRAERALAVRYSTELNSPVGHISYHAVYEKAKYSLHDLSPWTRKNVRRGLRNCSIQPVSFDRLAQDGWDLQSDTLARQGRRVNLSREAWRNRCLAAAHLPGFEAWGAFVDGHIAASVSFQMQDCYYLRYQQCLRRYLPLHVNNALSFVVTQTIMARPAARSILYGLHSLDAPESVDEFKFRMGYEAKPVRQRVVFHPWLAPAVNRLGHALLRFMVRVRWGDHNLTKAEGMTRFYLEGRRPLRTQRLPGPLQGLAFDSTEGGSVTPAIATGKGGG